MTAMINADIVTCYGTRRVKDRLNLKNQRAVEKNVQLALHRGKRAGDYSSWEWAYLNMEARDNCTAIAYNNFCYIFNARSVCVILYPLPGSARKAI